MRVPINESPDRSRLSPFANTKRRKEKTTQKQKEISHGSNDIKLKKLQKWFSLIDATAAFTKKKVPAKKLQSTLFLKNELHKTLYGFIVFEVEWTNVRGISYLNELQTGTSLAIEAKVMQRWEYESIDQAVTSMSVWFSGTKTEKFCLKKYLDTAIGEVFYDAETEFSRTTHVDDGENLCHDNLSVDNGCPHCIRNFFDVYPCASADYDEGEPHTPPLTGPCKRRRVTKAVGSGVEVDVYMEETPKRDDSVSDHWENHVTDGENIGEATQYKDVLVLVRFNDRDLPFKLREIIMADIRLLTLLEAGLPSWVLFLQSYPGFCHLYRPWMCPLARALYIMISLITVVIGFYDLYKNVPLLKATASRLCGPLFDWIETWDMVSRIQYLGTMLFLHNFQKAVKWTLTVGRALRSFFSFLVMPLAKPLIDILELLLPLWNLMAETVESFVSVIWVIIGSSCSLVGDMVDLLLLPIWFTLSLIWNVTTFILLPIFWIIWEVVYAPIRAFLALANFSACVFSSVYEVVRDVWVYTSSMLQLASDSHATVKTYEVSMLRSLWNDLFSHIFRAVRSILNGFVAFFAACNRHRLSIYNHSQDFIHRVFGCAPRFQHIDSRLGNSVPSHQRTAETRRKLHVE
ncbi:PREDICTED: uncharacterized protein LOC104826134 isoform X2 [Tarenaya hassleriana]|uniref:uncharacterized protein LOC104826134 isoform X2 n=1 Tax=Tarenaya hassleriana TaxID=28532 RepID=UPI00053C6BAA|nr:PREDICTED: uncharacterized protein LOC104826134 isoform X2 [Tarenaya hassleriana]